MNIFNNNLIRYGLLSLFIANSFALFSQKSDDNVMSKSKGTYTINTSSLCNTIGYRSTTPLIITVRKDKIVSVEALRNMESPQYFARVRKMMISAYSGIKFKDYAKVDGVTGATMTSNAVKAHVAKAYEYYRQNK